MPAISRQSPGNADFARVVAVRGLPRSGAFAFDVSPDAEEAAAIARLLDARSVRKMRFSGKLTPDDAGWLLEGQLGASVVQTCVVTLDPVTTRIDLPVRRRFLPDRDDPRSEIVVGVEDDDDVEALGERIDLGLVAVEALALALPDYPRKPGAELPAGSPAGAEPEDERPFAGLAALRDRLGREGDSQ